MPRSLRRDRAGSPGAEEAMVGLTEEKRRHARSLLLRYLRSNPLPRATQAVAFGYRFDGAAQVADVAISVNGRTRLACAVDPEDGELRELPRCDWPPHLYFSRN